MKKNILYLSIIVFVGLLLSCEPRIDFDEGQWGDTAFITNVNIFTLQVDEHELQEYYENGTLTPARKRIFISSGSATIDNDNFVATVTVPEDQDITRAGIVVYHQSVRVEPVGSSPVAGILHDLSAKEFVYKLVSADGTTHDWTIKIVH
ncbi:DUF5018-related domain-containing protein [Sunxiuqinia sp. sy24]|uniref:DUF5018-related domain-containing protein n=1 Tax=Sunxiuqinia sp. sy24 TaxID=3461495 RepID=UPI0040464B86